MSTGKQKYEITFAFRNCDAMATVSVEAYDEAHAIRLSESTLCKDLGPELHHIHLVA